MKNKWRKIALANEEEANQIALGIIRLIKSKNEIAYYHVMKELQQADLSQLNMESLKEILDIVDRELYGIMYETTDLIEQSLGTIYTNTRKNNYKVAQKEILYVSPFQVEAVVKERFHGKTYSERLWNNTSLLAERLKQSLTTMVTQGTSYDALSNQIAKEFQVSYSQAKRVIVTEANRVLNKGALDSYKELGVKEVLHLAENDSCSVCRALDGTKYPIGEHRVTQHPYCRCTVQPVIPGIKVD